MTKVIYRPTSDMPAETTWNGVTFLANVPVDLTDEHGYEIEEGHRTTDANGRLIIKTVKRFVTMVEMAKGNPSFEVDGSPPPKKRGRPTNAEIAARNAELGHATVPIGKTVAAAPGVWGDVGT